VTISETEVSNSAYNYKYHFYALSDPTTPVEGFFILKNLALKILDMNIPTVISSHHNWHSKYTNLTISTWGMHNGKLLMMSNNTDVEKEWYQKYSNLIVIDNELVKKSPQHIHRLNLSETLSTRLWSPSIKQEAYLIQLLSLAIIRDILATTDDVFVVPDAI
jgi:hypothetical protein